MRHYASLLDEILCHFGITSWYDTQSDVISNLNPSVLVIADGTFEQTTVKSVKILFEVFLIENVALCFSCFNGNI